MHSCLMESVQKHRLNFRVTRSMFSWELTVERIRCEECVRDIILVPAKFRPGPQDRY